MGSQRFAPFLALSQPYNYIAENPNLDSTMAAFVNLLLVLLALTLMPRDVSAGTRGCRCYVKDGTTGPPLADTWFDVGSGWFAGCNNKHREKCRNACREWVKSLGRTNKDSPIFHNYSDDRTIYSKLDCDKAASFSSDRWMKNWLPPSCLDNVCWKRSREPSSGYKAISIEPSRIMGVGPLPYGGGPPLPTPSPTHVSQFGFYPSRNPSRVYYDLR